MLNQEQDTENEYLFLLPKDFFTAPNFIERLEIQLAVIERDLRTEAREPLKITINLLYTLCCKNIEDVNTKLRMHLAFIDTLLVYAQQYQSMETYKNIINIFENQTLKDKLFSKFPVKANLAYGQTLFQYYNLLDQKDKKKFSKSNILILIKAKYYLLKIYTQYIEKKNPISDVQLSSCLSLLSGCLAQLSRWFEPLYYLNIAKEKLMDNPNVEYLRAANLEAIKDKACLNYNGLLILQIIDSCRETINNQHCIPEQKQQSIKMERACLDFLDDNKQSIEELRLHKEKVLKGYEKNNAYEKFCLNNQLFLNEHSFFCNCKQSTYDDLVIETSHLHTKIDWVKKFEGIIENISSDFTIARHSYYLSLSDTPLKGLYIHKNKAKNAKEQIKSSLLKNSFKICYSILDQICYGILQVLEIDYEKKLKENNLNTDISKLYFLNMWDLELFEDSLFDENFYLVSLYSIAKDLDRTQYSALKNFKEIRNTMEHKILYIQENQKAKLSTKDIVYTKEELLEKTKLLLILTKSAIISYTYLIRRQSKLKETNL